MLNKVFKAEGRNMILDRNLDLYKRKKNIRNGKVGTYTSLVFI